MAGEDGRKGPRGDFLAPPARFRSAPFWGWNDLLDPEELRRQVREMADRGFGGFYIHSREGLETPYLGEAWVEAVRVAVHEAKAVGLEVWIYDEDRWPSGFAGGKVPARGDAFRAKGLTMELGAPSVPEDAVAAYAVEEGAGDAALSVRRLPLPVRGSEGPLRHEILAVLRSEVSMKSDWFNGEAPPDNLNPDCVDAFIEETHEAYFRAAGNDFGGTIRGFFFDEPGVHDRHASMTAGRGWIPWTDGFAAFFRERRGYDFLDAAPLVFLDGPGSAAARHDYWRTLAERFRETFSGRIGTWCRKRGVQSSGHLLWEGDLGVATRVCGSIMPNYFEMDLPGIDILGISDREVSTVKQCASVANQFGKAGVVSEMYGTAGWNLSFERQRSHGDWQAALGVTLRCEHHALYSIRGCRKRDYPPSFNYQSCWWRETRVMEDYFARLNAALSGGKPVRDVLVLHPACSAWSRIGTAPRGFARRGLDRDLPWAKEYGERFNALLRYLVEDKRDCDVGDEILMRSHTSIEVSGPPVFRIGLARYRAIVLPELDSVLPETLDLIRRFAEAGGLVVVLGTPPSMVEGRPSPEARRFFGGGNLRFASDFASVAELLDAVLPRQVDVLGEDGSRARSVWSLLADHDEGSVLFLTNRDDGEGCWVEARVLRSGSVEEWDCLAGTRKPAEFEAWADGTTLIRTDLGPSDSRLFMFAAKAASAEEVPEVNGRSRPAHDRGALGRGAQSHGAQRRAARSRVLVEFAEPESVEATMPNALILDRASFRIEDGPWSEELPLWMAQDRVRAVLGLQPIAASEGRQRYLWVGEAGPRDGTAVAFRFRFEVAEVPPDGVKLALEGRADVRRIRLNGEDADYGSSDLGYTDRGDEGWYVDRSMRISRLPMPKTGTNEIEVEFAYLNRTEAEDCAVIGTFSVRPDRRIDLPSDTLRLGDWTVQGFYHYPGSLVYHFTMESTLRSGERYELDPGSYYGTTIAVRVNGARVGSVPWRAAAPLDLTDFLDRGINLVDIEVFGGPRNFLGPFHCAEGETPPVDWTKFRRYGTDYSDAYSVVPCGLTGPVRIVAVAERRPQPQRQPPL